MQVITPKRPARRPFLFSGMSAWLLLSAGCSLLPAHRPQAAPVQPPVPALAAEKEAPPAPSALRVSQLTADMVYRTLAAETLVLRGDPATAARVYLELAQDYPGESRWAQRAYELSTQASNRDLLASASALNTQRNPAFLESWQVQVVLKLKAGDLDGALESWEAFYQHAHEQGVSDRDIFLSTATLGHDGMSPEVLRAFSARLLATHPSVYAEFAHGLILSAVATPSEALAQTQGALTRFPDQVELVQLAISLLQKQASPAVLAQVQAYMERHPADVAVGEQLARYWVTQGDLPKAAEGYRQVLLHKDGQASARMSLSLIQLELGQLNEAEAGFRLLEKDKRYADMARYYLGQTLYQAGREAEAVALWEQVRRGEYRLDALIWRAQVLARAGQGAQAVALLEGFEAADEGERVKQVRSLVRLHLLMGNESAALARLDAALTSLQESADLWQERANLRFERGDKSGFEQDIRRAIALEPDNADALNALGFHLAEENRDLPQARQLLDRANALAPGRHYITDSLGWLAYREGRLEEAEALLDKAYGIKGDGEILRHWLEVLVAMGRRDQAMQLAQSEAGKYPQDAILQQQVRQLLGGNGKK